MTFGQLAAQNRRVDETLRRFRWPGKCRDKGGLAEGYCSLSIAFPLAGYRILMKIDIDTLNEAELVDLNHRVVARLRFLEQMRAHAEMLEFGIGDRVVFELPARPRVEGMVTRYNKKTVTVITDDGRQWNISPHFLNKIVSPTEASRREPNLISPDKHR